MTKLSIIIPILNEVNNINSLLAHLENNAFDKRSFEIIIVDGGSIDGCKEVITTSPTVKLIESSRGRATQMNAGAIIASSAILYFLHCDSLPPRNFDQTIIDKVAEGNLAGCFRMIFDDPHPVLRFSQWFTRFNNSFCRGGDQSLFITNELFIEIGGFDENFLVYEDNEIITRLYTKKHFIVLNDYIVTSARRYRENGVWRLQYHFFIIHMKRKLGHSPESLLKYYTKHIACGHIDSQSVG